ncbi:MAG: hypothetical protein AAF562_10380 [Pseudomonadota bacterium]
MKNPRYYILLTLFLFFACKSPNNNDTCYFIAIDNGILSDSQYTEFVWTFYQGLHERGEMQYFLHPPFGDEDSLYLYADCDYLQHLFNDRLSLFFFFTEIEELEYKKKRRQLNPTIKELEQELGKIFD